MMRKQMLYIGLMILWVLCMMVGEGRANVVVTEAEIHAAVTGYVRDVASNFSGEIEVSVRRRGDLHIPGVGAVQLRVRPDRMPGNARSLPVVLEMLRGPAVIGTHHIMADVQYFDDVVVAARSIDRGEALSEDGVVVERRDVTMMLGKYFSSLGQIDGMRARMRIGLGRPLNGHFVETIPLVERGDMVRIQARIGGIVAITTGIARDSGAQGDRIVVRNATSREMLQAEVIGPGTVQVVF